jgi:ribonuclease J
VLEIDRTARAKPAASRWAASASIPARWTKWSGHGDPRPAHLSEDGIVLPIIAINRNTGRMESLPEIVSRGFAAATARNSSKARQLVAKTLEGSNQEEKTDWGVMKEKIRADLKRYIVKETSQRPLIMPVILEV